MKIPENSSSQIIEELKKENTRLRHELSQIYASQYYHSIKDLKNRISGVNLLHNFKKTDEPEKNYETLAFKIKRKRIAQLLLLIVFILCFQNIIGLVYNNPFFKSLLPEWSTMRIVTALCFILSASSVGLLQIKWKSKIRNTIIKIIEIAVALTGLLTILVYVIVLRTGHESLLGSAPFLKNFLNTETRMAFVTAILFTGTSFVLLSLTLNNPRAQNLAHAIIMPVLVVSYFVPLSFILGRISVFSVNQTPIALYTGICFCLLGVSILLFYPRTWFMRIFTDRFTGGDMARTLIQGIIIAPIIISWMINMGQQTELFEPKTGMILIAETYTFCFLALIWFAARRVIKIEKIQRTLDASLRNQAHFITNITETIPDMISVLELPSRKIVYSNKEPFAKQGFSSDNLSKLTEEERNQLIYPEDRTLLSDYFAKLAKMKNDQVVTLEYRAKNFRGEWIWFNAQGKVFERYLDGSPKNCINVITNITGRKEAEEKLRQNEQRIQGMFDNAAIGIAEVDEKDKFINVNNRLCEILGYSREELLGKVVYDITSLEDIEHSKEINAKIHNNELEFFDYEKRYIKKDGSYLWVHVSLSAVRSEHGHHTIRTIEDVSSRKIAEEALKESEERFSTMFRSLSIGVSLLKYPELLLYDINPAWMEVMGFSRKEDVVGKTVAQLGGLFLDPGQREKVFKALAQNEQIRNEETEVINKKGDKHIISVNLDLVWIKGERYILSTMPDITDLKLAQKRLTEALTEAEEGRNMLTALMEHIPLGITIANAPPDTKIRMISKYGQGIYKKTVDEIAGIPPPERPSELGIYHIDGVTPAKFEELPLTRAIMTREIVKNEEWLIVREDGRLIPVLSNAAPIFDKEEKVIGGVLAWQDISDLRKALEALKQSEEMFSAMINVLPIGIVLSDFFDRRIYKVNPAWLQIMGYTEEEEVLGKTSAELGIVRDLVTQKQYLDEFMQFGNLRNLETTIFTKSGSQRIASINLDQVNIREQKYNLASVEDITDKKGMELELKQKNEELTRFVYTVSHDLKSPLVTIKSFTSFLQEDIEKQDKEAQSKDIQYITNAADKMGRLLNELLELSRIGKKEEPKSEVSMKTIAQSAIDLVAGRISQRNVQVIFTGPDVMLYGHQQRLLQLYQNLIDNAVKFMGEQSAPLIEIGSYLDSRKNQVVLFVRDNGAGINPIYHHKIFGLFEKLDAKAEGTGIGLALIKRIVEVHGGSIWFTSEGEGKGTTFYFTLEKTYLL